MSYIPVIGLEIHAELLTKSKAFCACKNSFGGEPNSRVCPVCMGFPGALPQLNKEAVTLAVRAGAALGCEIHEYSAFDRKNYFYPDLPKAYQITQFEYPICTGGGISFSEKLFRINRIHIEEDAGKLVHDGNGGTSSPVLLELSIPIAARDVKSARRRPVNFSINSYGIPWSATPAPASTGEENGFGKAFPAVRSDSAGSGGRGLPSYERM